jgi:hypothetical protein
MVILAPAAELRLVLVMDVLNQLVPPEVTEEPT